jgi:heme o synthase
MSKQIVSGSFQTDKTNTSIRSDIKALFKGNVLLANALPVFAGFWLALHFSGEALAGNGTLFLLTIIGSVLVMGGALVINNWYDVDIDTIMARTKHRPTVTGNIQLHIVLSIGVITSAAGLLLLTFSTWEAAIYAFIGWFTYVFPYTMWSKRRYTFNTIIGSVSGAVTPLIGWAALESSFHVVPITFALIIFIWQMPHTYAIAIRKHDEYKAAGVAMLPVVKGMAVTKRQMLLYTVLLLPLPVLLHSLGTIFVVIATVFNFIYIGFAVAGFFTKDDLVWARWMFLISVNYLMLIFILSILLAPFVF